MLPAGRIPFNDFVPSRKVINSFNYKNRWIFYMILKMYESIHLVLSSCYMILEQTYMNVHMLVLSSCSMVLKQTCMNLHM